MLPPQSLPIAKSPNLLQANQRSCGKQNDDELTGQTTKTYLIEHRIEQVEARLNN